MTKSRKVFVNLPVRNLARAVAFFRRLGFQFDPKFTDDRAARMVLSEDAYVMLLDETFFRTFTRLEPCDTRTHTEALLALSCQSRAEVDGLLELALASGGRVAMDPKEHGFMYYATFYDPDGHHWELVWMDEKAAA